MKYTPRPGRNTDSHLHAELVLLTALRGKVLGEAEQLFLKHKICEIASVIEVTIVKFSIGSDRIRMLISYPTKVCISKFVNSIKSVSSRKLREEFPKVPCHGDKLWSPTYLAVSCGVNSDAAVDVFLSEHG